MCRAFASSLLTSRLSVSRWQFDGGVVVRLCVVDVIEVLGLAN